MTGKAYITIHCLKALPLSIVRRPFLPIFINGIRRNLHLKSQRLANIFTSKDKFL